MLSNLFRGIVLLALVVITYLVIMWVIGYLHLYINGFFIPDELRWEGNRLREDQTKWYAAGMLIGVFEWVRQVWLSYRLNGWYSAEWPVSDRVWVVNISTAIVAGFTSVTLFTQYAYTINNYF